MSDRLLRGVIIGIFAGLVLTPVSSFAAKQSCESLASLKLARTTIIATDMPAGPFAPGGGRGAGAPAAAPAATQGAAPAAGGRGGAPMVLPAFCRVQLTVEPMVKIEVWLPDADWNGDFEGVGNGGLAGTITYAAMADALRKGYATASTDTGHQGGGGSFALGDPEKDARVKEVIEDFGYLAIHEMTVEGKQLTEAFYGVAPREAYFSGCSQGGRQALTEAQRYPDDYNGILAGAPGVNNTALFVQHVWVGLATFKDQESFIPPSKLAAIQTASLAACDELDGLKDNLVTDPRNCHFDPAVLLCKGADSDSCLTAKQVQTMKNLYSPLMDPSGKLIYPGHFPGAEAGWAGFTTGTAINKSSQYTYGTEFMKNFIFEDPNWDINTWDFKKDLPAVMNNTWVRSVLDSWDPDLKAFRDKGGKVIVYQGWGDEDVSPANTINYYKMVVAAMTGVGKGTDAFSPEPPAFVQASQKTGDFMRLFMIPGMNHCGRGLGPNTFDGVSALDNWREKKQAPDQIIATHLTGTTVDSSRPLCPYPQIAQYKGTGSTTDAASFACVLPKSK